jgi:pimeloyl-ACP methyl ester carboxylesterase
MGEKWTGPLHRLELPFKVIWGPEDPIAVPGIALKLQQQNRNARLVMLRDTGHYPQLESPERVAEEFGGFIRNP